MRKFLPLSYALGAVLLLAAGARADDETRAILEKAVKAAGGADKLRKPRAVHATLKGTIEAAGQSIPFTGDSYAQPPGQVKSVMDMEVKNQKVNLIQVLNKGKGWIQISAGGNVQTIELKDELADAIKEALYAERVKQLVPLLDDKSFELSPLGEVKVNDKPTVGIHVEAKGHKPVNLFFDKETSLVVKVESTGIGADLKETAQETYLSDYKPVDGVQVARKSITHHAGKKVTEVEITDVEFLDKLDDSEFAKP